MDTNQIFDMMRKDKGVRRAIVRRSSKFFFLYYFGHYIEFPFAPFHHELFDLMQNNTHSMMVVSAFRNSGKSTLLTLSCVIWSIINGRTKYALIISENQQKAQTFLNHIKEEFTNNDLLKRDLGPFQEDRAIWNSVSLVLNNYNAKITAISSEQSVRGLRHINHRPDLIVIDDSESEDTVRTQEARDKHYKWLSGDVIPAGHSHTKVVVVGSILHPDSLIPRLQKGIDEGKIDGIYRMYPIVDEAGHSLWPARFPDAASIEVEKKRGITDHEWNVEYLLKPMLEENQIIREEHVHYYDREPTPGYDTYTGVDLAISKNETADYTAMVSGVVVGDGDDWKLRILPYPVNERLSGPEIEERIVQESLKLGSGSPTPVFIENVAFQQSMIDFVQRRGIPAEGVSPGGTDKRARLISVSQCIAQKVEFPKRGAEKLINQLLYFGIGHDDLVDALIILILKVFERKNNGYTIPSLYKTTVPQTREEEEREADQLAILYQQAMRGDRTSMLKYNELVNKQPLYFNKEVGMLFRRAPIRV